MRIRSSFFCEIPTKVPEALPTLRCLATDNDIVNEPDRLLVLRALKAGSLAKMLDLPIQAKALVAGMSEIDFICLQHSLLKKKQTLLLGLRLTTQTAHLLLYHGALIGWSRVSSLDST